MRQRRQAFDLAPVPERLRAGDQRRAEQRLGEVRHAARAGLPQLERLRPVPAGDVDRAADDGVSLLVRVEHAARPVGRGQAAGREVAERLLVALCDERLFLRCECFVALSH